MAEPFTREEFEAWLRSKPRFSIVGAAMSGSKCPIARFMAEQAGGGFPSANSSHLHFPGLGNFDTPRWVRTFIRLVDGDSIYPRKSGLVTAGRARKILEEVDVHHKIIDRHRSRRVFTEMEQALDQVNAKLAEEKQESESAPKELVNA